MARYLVYYVAMGETHRRMARMSVDSLYLSGYAGEAHVVTDRAIAFAYAPADRVTQVIDPDASAWHAKRLKAMHPLGLPDPAAYEALLFTDCDTLVTGDVTPLLDRIRGNPTKLFVTNTAEGSRQLWLRGTQAWALMTPAERAANDGAVMVDSSGFGFVPTVDNMRFVAEWDNQNATRAATLGFKSDACGLNLALVVTGRGGDVEAMVECERMNGRPAPATIIRHYANGLTGLMPATFAAEIEMPHLAARGEAA